MKKFKCKLCGFIEETNILKEDFICPKCGVEKSMFEELLETESRVVILEDNPSISRVEEKCVNCGICFKTCKDIVGIEYDRKNNIDPICIGCGQCRITCPRGAITEKFHYKFIDEHIKNTDKVVVALTSPAVRVSLGEEFNMEAGSFVEKKMVAALKTLGFNYVFDTTFGADLTSLEESHELLERIQNKGTLPMFSSCCPAWVKYTEIYHPSLINNLSSCKSPIGMQSTLIKSYFANARNINVDDIVVVAITPCTAKKEEILKSNNKYTDYVLTTNELALYLKEENIDLNNLEDNEFDSIFAKGSSSGTLFGTSGGVSESVIRTLYNTVTNKDLTNELNLEPLRSSDKLKKVDIDINGLHLRVGVIYGLKNIEPILKELETSKKCEFDFIEVMNCERGCVGGGGQPLNMINLTDDIIVKRSDGIRKSDDVSNLKYSYKNPDLIKIYNDYLEKPGSKIAHELLHTTFNDKSYLLK